MQVPSACMLFYARDVAPLHDRPGQTGTTNRQEKSPLQVRDELISFETHVDVTVTMLVPCLRGYRVDRSWP